MSTFQYKYNDLQRKWLDDLKTTTEPQTTMYLHRTGKGSGDRGFCCLGRACVVSGWPVFEEGHGTVSYGEDDDFNNENLPEGLVVALKLHDNGGWLRSDVRIDDQFARCLTTLNDVVGWTFKQIAEYIEANPDNVFSDYDEQKAAWEAQNVSGS